MISLIRFRINDLCNLRDDIPRPLYSDGITYPDVEPLSFIKIMQSGPLYNNAANINWCKICNRSNNPCSAYLKIERPNNSNSLLCRKLPGNSPTRSPAGGTKLFTLPEFIHLYYNSINIIIKGAFKSIGNNYGDFKKI